MDILVVRITGRLVSHRNEPPRREVFRRNNTRVTAGAEMAAGSSISRSRRLEEIFVTISAKGTIRPTSRLQALEPIHFPRAGGSHVAFASFHHSLMSLMYQTSFSLRSPLYHFFPVIRCTACTVA